MSDGDDAHTEADDDEEPEAAAPAPKARNRPSAAATKKPAKRARATKEEDAVKGKKLDRKTREAFKQRVRSVHSDISVPQITLTPDLLRAAPLDQVPRLASQRSEGDRACPSV